MQIRRHNLRTNWRRFVACLAIGLFVVLIVISFVPRPASSQAASPISGWAWSDTIGWISMSGVGYGLSMDSTSGTVTGYAWSDNIGWVKFGGLSSYPSGAGTTAADARVVSGNLTGWARACAGTAPGDCSTMTSRTDGWDGWISLSGTGYGVSYNPSTGAFGAISKFAWGDVNVGWVDFSGVSTAPLSCQVPPDVARCGIAANGENLNAIYDSLNNIMCNVCSYQCSNGACLAPPAPVCNIANGSNPKKCIDVHPLLIASNNVGATVSWNVSNVQSCSGVTSTNNDSWSAPVVSGTAQNAGVTSNILTGVTKFTLSCTGLDNNPYTWTATAEFVPSFKEL